MAAETPQKNVLALFAAAEQAGRVGTAKKTKLVDARPAAPGEVIRTFIKDEGKETESRPAAAGDMVVRNRCEETGNEEYLVSQKTFAERYHGSQRKAHSPGWQEYQPVGPELRFFVVGDAEGNFTFTAPWGEAMVARPGDAIVQDPKKPADTYRVARASFACTYEIIIPPHQY
jgi:hypothetical protein